MTQVRNHEYLANDDTLSINLKLLAVAPAGRYSGFYIDTSNTSGTQITLKHDGNPSGDDFTYPLPTDTQPTSFSNPIGAWLANGGVLVRENESVTLNGFTPNTSGNDRIDLIVGRHYYTSAVTGGVTAEYLFIEGTPSATPVRPTLTDPYTQTILGEIYVPDGTTDTTGITYTPEPNPEFARGNLNAQFEDILAQFAILEAQVQQLDADFTQLVIDFNTFTTNITNQQNAFELAITNQQNQFEADTLQLIADNIVEMRYDPDPLSPTYNHIQWKYTGEADIPANWRDLGIGVIFPSGTVFDLEVTYTDLVSGVPTPLTFPTYNFSEPNHGVLIPPATPIGSTDDNVITLPFRIIVSDPANAWVQDRHYKFPQAGTVDFVLELLELAKNPTFTGVTGTQLSTVGRFVVAIYKKEPTLNAVVQDFVYVDIDLTNPPSTINFPNFQFEVTGNQEDIVYVELVTPTQLYYNASATPPSRFYDVGGDTVFNPNTGYGVTWIETVVPNNVGNQYLNEYTVTSANLYIEPN